VDIYRNGVRVTATANDGEFTDKVNKKGNGTQTYMVCESGTSNCSNSVVASF
jgi:serine protease